MLTKVGMRRRAIAAGIHLSISALVAGLAALLVFGLWYPGPFVYLAGGRDLFLLVTGVDVVLGPVLTFSVFDHAKGKRHLQRDLAVIACIQLAGLAYGLYTVYAARPVAMVFEVDRMRLITASDVAIDELPRALPAYRDLPLGGPWLLGARRPRQGEERNDALFKGLEGIDIGARPIFWQPYEQSRTDALEKSKPIKQLLDRYPEQSAKLRQRLADMHADKSTCRFLPASARGAWAAVLDAQGHLLGYLPVEGFL